MKRTKLQKIARIFSPEGPERLIAEADDDPHFFLGELREDYRYKPLGRFLIFAAHSIEPVDRNMNIIDPLQHASGSFFVGGLPAVFLAYKFISRSNIAEMGTMGENLLTPGEGEDKSHVHHQRAQEIMTAGDEGYYRAPMYHDLFDAWENKLYPEVTYQHELKAGFGLIMHLASKIYTREIERYSQYQAEEVMSTPYGTPFPVDWEWETSQLLREHP